MRSEAWLAGLALSVATLVPSCGPRTSVLHPKFPDGGMLKDSTPPAADSLVRFEALTRPSDSGRFGAHALVHATSSTISFFGESNATYALLHAGCVDGGTRLVLEGTWRDPQTTSTGLVRLFAGPPELVAVACGGADAASVADAIRPTFEGFQGSGAALPDQPLSFTYEADRVNLRGKFRSAAHHGACPTIDDCGWSENTVESIRNVEAMGATVVEVDVRTTKDGVPVLFHDEELGPRLAAGELCHGAIADYTLAELRALCTAKFGEAIPTLAEGIDAVLTDTSLVEVWLDVKTPDSIAPTIRVIRDEMPAAAKRKLAIVVGLGESDVLDAYHSTPHDGITCLCELEPSDVLAADCAYWAPRWTQGPRASDVAALRAQGRKTIYWTIDDLSFIDKFVTEGRPDGVLSDHPGLVMERMQVLKATPK
jgi:glycerophosphoryl diester phosphodiesterase